MELFYNILLFLDGIIYSFIDKLYQLFMALASARILTEENIQHFMDRIYIVLGVIMLFVLAYSILMSIINPDNMNKSENGTGKIVKNIVISLVFLALTPAVFNILYRVQDVTLRTGVIGKLILGDTNDSASQSQDFGSVEFQDEEGNVTSQSVGSYSAEFDDSVYKYGGRTFAYEMFYAFFQPAAGVNPEDVKAENAANYVPGLLVGGTSAVCALGVGLAFVPGINVTIGAGLLATCVAGVAGAGWNLKELIFNSQTITLAEARNMALSDGNFGVFAAFTENVKNGEINYSALISTIAGLIALYVLFSFCIDLGLRAAKLAYFQMIAPIPILFKIVPKGGKVFDTWVKKVTSTFFEVFVRIFIIYFVIYLICKLPDLAGDFWGNSLTGDVPDGAIALLARAFILLGLIVFAKQAPKLIGEMFGINGGSIKLGIREKLADGGVMRGGAALGAGVQTAIRNFNNQKGFRRFTSALGGFGGGAVGGFVGSKDAKNFTAMRKAKDDAVRKAEAKRDARVEKRNYLNSMTDEDGNQMGYWQSRATNFADNVKSWAGVGPTTGEYTMYDNIQKREKEIKSAAEGLFAKYDKKSFLENMDGKFKGDTAARAQALYDKYIKGYDMSYKEAEAQYNSMKNRDTSTMSEADRVNWNKDIKAFEDMLAQLKKKSILKMENELNNINIANATSDAALNGTFAEGMKLGELKDLQSRISVFAEEFNRSGIKTDIYGNSISFDSSQAGNSSDDIATAMGDSKTKISQEIERQKRREAATKGDKK